MGLTKRTFTVEEGGTRPLDGKGLVRRDRVVLPFQSSKRECTFTDLLLSENPVSSLVSRPTQTVLPKEVP